MSALKHTCPRCGNLDNTVDVTDSQVNHFPGLIRPSESQVVIRYEFTCDKCGYRGKGKLNGWLKEEVST